VSGTNFLRAQMPRALSWLTVLSFLFLASAVQAQEEASSGTTAAEASSAPGPLIAVTKEAAPFVMKAADGSLEGIAIDLWKDLSAQLSLTYEFEEMPLEGLLLAVAEGEAQIGVAALTVTAGREAEMDFTHPYFTTGWAIAVPAESGSLLANLVDRLFSEDLAYALGALILVLFVAGFFVWIFEARANRDQFGGGPARGLGNGFWWAAVTMTTVGYGDKAPATLGGRVVGLIWMFASIIIISSFTAAIASSLTVTRLESQVQNLTDLRGLRVGTLGTSASESFLAQRSIVSRPYDTVAEGLQAIADGRLDAFFHDAPILRYRAREDFPSTVSVLPQNYGRQDYAFALPQGSELREPLNQALNQYLASDAWPKLRARYLPPQE